MSELNTATQVIIIPEICTNCKKFKKEEKMCKIVNLEPKIGLFGKIYCKRCIPKD